MNLAKSVLLVTVGLGLAGPAAFAKIQGTIPVRDLKKEAYADSTKVTLADAIEAALENAPGKAVEAELDTEDGFLVYEVKVLGANHQKAEVLVDAGSKAILRVEKK